MEREAPDAATSMGSCFSSSQLTPYAAQIADAMLRWVRENLDAGALSQAVERLRVVWGNWEGSLDGFFCAKVRARCAGICAWSEKRREALGVFPPWLVLAEFWCMQRPLPKALATDACYASFRALARREQGMAQAWAGVLNSSDEGATCAEAYGAEERSDGSAWAGRAISLFMSYCRAQAWLESGQAARAVERLESDLAKGAEHPILWLLLADAATEQGEFGKADYAAGMARAAAPRTSVYALGDEAHVDMPDESWERIVGGFEAKLGRSALETIKRQRAVAGNSRDLAGIDEALFALALKYGDVRTRCEAIDLAFSVYVVSDRSNRSFACLFMAAQTLADDVETCRLFLSQCALKAENIVTRAMFASEEYACDPHDGVCRSNDAYKFESHSSFCHSSEFCSDSAWVESLYDLYVRYEKAAVPGAAESELFRALTQIDAPSAALEGVERSVDKLVCDSALYWSSAGLCVALGLASNEIGSVVFALSSAFGADSPRATLLLLKLLSGVGRDGYRWVAELLAQSIGAQRTGILFARLQRSGDPYQTLSRQIAEIAAREESTQACADRGELGRYMLPIELQAVYAARRAMALGTEEAAKRSRRHDVLMARGLIEKDTMQEAPKPAQWRHERTQRASDAFES